jgi:hypothetical protein
MLYTIVWVGVLVGTFALMTWLLQASFKAEDRQHLAELNEEYKELLQHEGREQPGLQRTTGWLAPGGPAVRGTGRTPSPSARVPTATGCAAVSPGPFGKIEIFSPERTVSPRDPHRPTGTVVGLIEGCAPGGRPSTRKHGLSLSTGSCQEMRPNKNLEKF